MGLSLVESRVGSAKLGLGSTEWCLGVAQVDLPVAQTALRSVQIWLSASFKSLSGSRKSVSVRCKRPSGSRESISGRGKRGSGSREPMLGFFKNCACVGQSLPVTIRHHLNLSNLKPLTPKIRDRQDGHKVPQNECGFLQRLFRLARDRESRRHARRAQAAAPAPRSASAVRGGTRSARFPKPNQNKQQEPHQYGPQQHIINGR